MRRRRTRSPVGRGAIIGVQTIGGAGPHLAQLRLLQPRAMVVVDPNVDDMRALRAVCPNTYIVGRIYVPDGEMEARIRAGPEAAADWSHAQFVNHPARPYINAWIMTNEILQFWDGLPLLNRYSLRLMILADSAGYKVAIGGISVGQLDLPVDDRMALWRLLDPSLAYADEHDHPFASHQYGAPDLWGPVERGGAAYFIHRIEMQVIPRLRFKHLKFIVSEYGIDGGVLPAATRAAADEPFGVGVRTPPKELRLWRSPTEYGTDPGVMRGAEPRGWAAFTTPEDYAQQLINIGQHCEQWADRVIGYCVFTLGGWGWRLFDIAGRVLELLAQHYSAGVGPVEPPPPPPPPPPPQEEPMDDPRDPNCRALHTDASGKVDGVKLTYLPLPGKFVLKRVRLIDEVAAAGQTVATILVYDKNGMPMLGPKVYLAWEWDGVGTTFENRLLPGNTNYPPNHVIVNGYDATVKQGPLAIYVGNDDGSINSDVIAGLGLPWNRHVGYEMLFQERGTVTPPPPPEDLSLPEDEPVATPAVLADKVRWWMEESVRQDEAGNTARATAIRYSLIKLSGGLLYRLERALKNGLAQG